jgi:hypothetical protein
MEGSPQDYSKGLQLQAAMLLQASSIDAKSGDQPERDRYCRLILARTSDLIGACSLFVEGSYAVAGQIIMRSMLEDLIRILWATLEEANAAHLLAHGLDELKRALRANLQGGTAQIKDREGNDHSHQFVRDGKLSPAVKKKSVELMAQEAEAIGLYNMFYRFTSLQAHGNMLDEPRKSDPLDVSAILSGAGAISKATGHVGVRWLLGRERPSNKELLELLGVQ